MKLYFTLPVLVYLSFLIPFSAASQEKAQPIFKDGEAQVVPAFKDSKQWIRHDLWVETSFDSDRDGSLDRMHVSVTRPAQTETQGLKLPVIYISSPYFAGVAGNNPDFMWDVKHELGAVPRDHIHPSVTRTGVRPIISDSHIKTWVPRGYIVVHSSSPGTGLSQGAPTVGGANESLAPKAVVEWLCGRAKGFTEAVGGEPVEAYWSTRKVGMTGTSYNGTLALAAATTGVEGLEAIIPIAPNTSYYHYYRSNGLVRSPGGYLGEDIDVLYELIHSGDEAKRASNNAYVRDSIMKYGMDRITGDYNDFWAGRDYINHMDSLKAPMLMSHGFNDWNVMPEHSLRIIEVAKANDVPVQIYYHQGGHGGPPPMTMRNRWFTRYLHGIKNGVENDARAWIVRETDPMIQPTAYADYPNPAAELVTLYLSKGGQQKGGLSTKKGKKSTPEKLVDNYSIPAKDLVQLESSPNRLLYTTPILSEDLHISGTPSVTIRVASSKPAANLSVFMASLPWTKGQKITNNLITRGWADPQNHSSLTDGEPLIPGEFYEVTFTLMPDDQIIKAGQQIGLMIFSSDQEHTLWPEPGTELTIDLEGTELNLPIVGGSVALEKAFKRK